MTVSELQKIVTKLHEATSATVDKLSARITELENSVTTYPVINTDRPKPIAAKLLKTPVTIDGNKYKILSAKWKSQGQLVIAADVAKDKEALVEQLARHPHLFELIKPVQK